MNNLPQIATLELVRFLSTNLPKLSDDWWQKQVINRLSFQQQRMAEERRFTKLEQLDLAALLRIFDQNWFELSSDVQLPREGRNWIKELQTVRNKWAHASIEEVPASEKFRDADTLSRLLDLVNADESSKASVEKVKTEALLTMAPKPAFENKQEDMDDASESKIASVTSSVEHEGSMLFSVGELVALRSDPNTVFPVIVVIEGIPEHRYTVFENNSKETYYESQLQSIADPTDEIEVLDAREIHAHLTGLQLLSPSTEILFSLRSGRVEFVPYQYRPVLKLIRADRPRLLIADEVGVGKTIEAGLIIKELRARMDLQSVLVICPKALVAERKWHSEMKRFDENFTALDGSLLRHCLQETHLDGEWPSQYSKAILPFSLFDFDLMDGGGSGRRKKVQGLMELDPPPKFDLVIVDEAHHIRNPETALHQGIRYFCDNAEAVILMTATPVQLGSEDLFTLLNVLRPDLVIDRNSFEQMAEPNRFINSAVHHCRLAESGWNADASACLENVANTEWGRLFLREAPVFQTVYDRLQEDDLCDVDRVEIIQTIESLYTFNSVINRTRRRDIGEFTVRKPETLSIDFTPEQQQLHDSLLDIVSRVLGRCHGQQNVKFMMTTIRRQSASCLFGLVPLLEAMLGNKVEQLNDLDFGVSGDNIDISFVETVQTDIESMLQQVRELDSFDPKVEAFVKVIKEKSTLPNNKALVFSTFRHTLAYLAEHLDEVGIRYGLVHGGIKDDDRADIRKRFALPKDDPNALDVLLSSEVGCEGLDFQFCDFLVNYDLPWNPMKVEQRIGRIDRYGQASDVVVIVNFVTPGTVDADIYDRCLWRIGVFHHAVGGSEEILGTITNEIQDIGQSYNLDENERALKLQQLADNQIRIIKEEQTLEQQQAELFGLNIPNQSWEDEIAEVESFWLSPQAIQLAVVTYLSGKLGADTERLFGEKSLKTLRLSQEARNRLLEDYRLLPKTGESVAREWEKWLKGGQSTLSVTFDQDTAASNPKSMHLSVLHPLVRQAARYLEIHEPKFCAFSVLSNEFPPGDFPFAIYQWSKRGVKPAKSLIAVCETLEIESTIFTLLRDVQEDNISLPDQKVFDALDIQHHRKWSKDKANLIESNTQLVEHRIHSLTVSHRARCNTIEEQIVRSTNEKIERMRKSELARANANFHRKVAELAQLRETVDIKATPVIFGVLRIIGSKT